jgi:hypothetical protein
LDRQKFCHAENGVSFLFGTPFFMVFIAFQQLFSFFLPFVEKLSYLCPRTSALCLGGGAGATLWVNNNSIS